MMEYTNTQELLGTQENEKALNYFECYMDNVRGFLVPTDTRLMFIQNGVEEDQKPLEIKYDMIEEIRWSAENLWLTEMNASKGRKIQPIDTSLQLLEKIIKSELKNKPPAEDYCYCTNHIIKYE
ncbi:MAG: PH domain-containing protein [Candidatus Bathyarchaeota archaeon]|nr:PH domain-containing protein [Candidatus Bathyarchaeota archaeon]